jgi:hypothetical protein
MTLKGILEQAVSDGRFSIESARRVIGYDWRTLISDQSGATKRDAESLFYFIEGYVEEVAEGFVDQKDDPELYERAQKLLAEL